LTRISNLEKNLLIFLYPFNFRYFDFDRYECKYIKKDFQLEIHEFNKILYPHFLVPHKENLVNYSSCISFKSVDEWEKYFIKKIDITNKIGLKIYVLNYLQNDNFSTFKIFKLLNKFKITRIDILNPGLPVYSHDKEFYFKKFFDLKTNFGQLIYRTRYLFENFKIIIKKAILNSILKNFYNIKPNFFLVAGTKYINELKKKYKIIRCNTWDYSRFLRLNKQDNFYKKNYAVYLAHSGPENISDSHFWKTKTCYTFDWYTKLNFFFNEIEKKYNLKVIIALHPKDKPKKKHPYLNQRSCFYNKTAELVKNSKFVLTINSTSISYAILYSKPICFIYSNENYENPGDLRYSMYLANKLGIKSINIDKYTISDLTLKYSKKKYKDYIKNYLIGNDTRKKNYEIISNFLKLLSNSSFKRKIR